MVIVLGCGIAVGWACGGGDDTSSYYERLEERAVDVRDDIFALDGRPDAALSRAAEVLRAFGADVAELQPPADLAVPHARLVTAIAVYADYASASAFKDSSTQAILSDPNAPAVRAFTDALCAIERAAVDAGARVDLGCIGVR
jgi:hypothetical protein